jgi:LysM repeat protein
MRRTIAVRDRLTAASNAFMSMVMKLDSRWATRIGAAGISAAVVFYAVYLSRMAPDNHHVAHSFRVAHASLAGVLTGDPLSGFMEPMTVRHKFQATVIVPEAQVVSGLADEPEAETASESADETAFDQIPTPSLSLFKLDQTGDMAQSANMSTVEEFLALDEEAFEMDDSDLVFPELSEDSGHGASFTYRTHRSRKGETLAQIATQYRVPVDQLEVIHHRSGHRIVPEGENILIPQGLGTFHQVTRGDTLWTVAKRYNLKPATILFLNKSKQEDITLKDGERLFIPLGVIDTRDAREIAANRLIRNVLENKLSFAWPVHGRISSRFGWRNHPILHRGRMHKGIDIAVPHGTTIRAAERGRVVWSSWRGGAGLCVIIEHPNGMYSIYMHCSKILVHRGTWVSRRQAVARVGSTGMATGPHLHFSLKRDGEMINPMKYLIGSAL